MKTTLLLLALTMISTVAIAGDDFTNVPTVEIYDLGAQVAGFEGKVIKIKFGYREGELIAGYKGHLVGKMSVVVPDEGRAWFNGISTQVSKQNTLSVIARIQNGRRVLLGRDIRNGAPIW